MSWSAVDLPADEPRLKVVRDRDARELGRHRRGDSELAGERFGDRGAGVLLDASVEAAEHGEGSTSRSGP